MREMPHRLIYPERKVLHDPLNHRIDNAFALIISAVSLVAGSSNDDVKTILNNVTEIIHCCADVHRALQTAEHDISIDADAYLRQLCLSIKRYKLDRMEIDLVFAACPLQLQSDRCWRLGMVLYELVMNSTRHAFAGGRKKILVELSHADSVVACTVLDNGTPPTNVHLGQGLRIVNELTQSLDGRFEQQFGVEGSKSVVVFPLLPRNVSAAVVSTREGDGAGPR